MYVENGDGADGNVMMIYECEIPFLIIYFMSVWIKRDRETAKKR